MGARFVSASCLVAVLVAGCPSSHDPSDAGEDGRADARPAMPDVGRPLDAGARSDAPDAPDAPRLDTGRPDAPPPSRCRWTDEVVLGRRTLPEGHFARPAVLVRPDRNFEVATTLSSGPTEAELHLIIRSVSVFGGVLSARGVERDAHSWTLTRGWSQGIAMVGDTALVATDWNVTRFVGPSWTLAGETFVFDEVVDLAASEEDFLVATEYGPPTEIALDGSVVRTWASSRLRDAIRFGGADGSGFVWSTGTDVVLGRDGVIVAETPLVTTSPQVVARGTRAGEVVVAWVDAADLFVVALTPGEAPRAMATVPLGGPGGFVGRFDGPWGPVVATLGTDLVVATVTPDDSDDLVLTAVVLDEALAPVGPAMTRVGEYVEGGAVLGGIALAANGTAAVLSWVEWETPSGFEEASHVSAIAVTCMR